MAFKVTWKSIRLSCFRPQGQPLELKDHVSSPGSARRLLLPDISDTVSPISPKDLSNSLVGSNLHAFTLAELKLITNDYASGNFLGEGGFGPVYKGFIDDKIRPGLQAQPVAVKLLDLDGGQGHKEWLTEVIFLGQLRHPHLVKLIGYCCEDEHRLLVYEYMARGNLENQLFRRYLICLPWLTRIKIALAAAKGLAFLHEEEKSIIYRDFKASNILLDSDHTAKLSDFGFAKEGPEGDKTHVTTRVMGTQGYAAPEYVMTGHLTTMSDVYSFGVVLLELITGKKALDKNRPSREQNLVEWAKPMVKDPHKLERIMDTRLEGQYSIQGAIKVAALAYQCLRHNPRTRPTMKHVVKVLEPVLDLNDIPAGPFVYIVPTDGKNRVSELTADKQGLAEEEEKEMDGCEGVAAKVEVRKGNGYNRHRRGRKHRHRMRSRTVFSDTALYKIKRQELGSLRNKDEGEEQKA